MAEAIEELARLGMNAKSEHARIAAIHELIDRSLDNACATNNEACKAWTFFANDPNRIASITTRSWATAIS